MVLLSQSSHLIPQHYLAAELLAAVVWRLFPRVTLVGGGINSLGFYYDFVLEQPLTENMLELIEIHLYRFIKEEHSVRFISMMRENAQSLFEYHQHFLLAQQVAAEDFNIIELVQIGDFYGLCPELSFTSTQEVGHVKLLDSTELTQDFHGEEIHITRLTGTTQKSTKDLKSFKKCYNQYLKKRDHRTLGPLLNLFSFDHQMSSLGTIWHSNGMRLRCLLQDWRDQHLPEHIKHISTPLARRQDFLESYPQSLESFLFEGSAYQLRSSPLKQHIYFLQKLSLDIEDLPYCITEETIVFQQYPEVQRWGLLNNCVHLTDQTTICCTKNQVVQELISSLHFIEQIITIFSFEAQWYLIASRQKSSKAGQEKEAIELLKEAIQAKPRFFTFFPDCQEEDEGEGPRLELRIRDGIGREWAASTLGIVLQINEAKSLLIQEKREQPWVFVNQQLWGSLDRFIALLVESYEGKLPFWLAPEQVRIFAIGETNRAYAKQVSQSLQQKGLRVKLDLSQAKLSIRVHEAEKENVPYLVLLGEKERIKQKLSVRIAGRFHQNETVDLETFFNKLHQESLWPVPKKEKATMLTGESESA